jgi:hypothetical protein
MSKLYPGNDRFCRVIAPEHHLALADAGQCKWPQRRITYSELLILNGMARDDVKATFDLAWKQWADVCDIEPVRLPPLDVMKPATASVAFANVAATQGPIDGPWGTLAYSYLPCGVAKDSQLTQKYDNGETWTRDYFLACACHEIGHALGLNHLDVGNLMAPILDPNITKPQPGDIAEILARYGPPATAPTPTPVRRQHLRLRPSPTTWHWMGRGTNTRSIRARKYGLRSGSLAGPGASGRYSRSPRARPSCRRSPCTAGSASPCCGSRGASA